MRTPITWHWDFGDGFTADTQVASHTYAFAGRYIVFLTVTDDAGGSDTRTFGYVETVNTAIPTPVSWDWVFGDGNVASGQVASNTYATMGRYSASLTVTDDVGGSDTRSFGYIESYSSDVPESWSWVFGDGNTASGQVAINTYSSPGIFTVVLTKTDTGGISGTGLFDIEAYPVVVPDVPVSWDWTFGDGNIASGLTVSNTYFTPNKYSVGLTVVDSKGRSSNRSFSSIEAYASVVPDVPVSWDWTFGDGGIASGQNALHTYATPGKYTVGLTVVDSKGRSITRFFGSLESTVTYLLDRIFSWNFGDGSTAVGQAVSHTYLGAGLWPVLLSVVDSLGNSNAKSYVVGVWDNRLFYTWDFGDGSPEVIEIDDNEISHTFITGGVLTVNLEMSDTWQRSSFASPVEIIVFDVKFEATPLAGDASLTVQFTDQSTGGATSWLWDFGDSTSSTEQNPTHTYAIAGIYTVTLSINSGAATKVKTDYITVNFVPDFVGTPLVGDSPLTVQFTDQSLGGATSWLWDFGDSTTFSTEQNPTHTYAIAGTFTVVLSLNGGVATETKVDYIMANINANFVASSTSGSLPLSVDFTDLSTGTPLSWAWDFGDGSPLDTTRNPTHIYTNIGLYAVTLTAYRNSFYDTVTKTDYIQVFRSGYAIAVEDTSVPIARQDLRIMYGLGTANYVVIKKGIRVVILASNSTPAGSGFSRVQGPAIVFD